MQKYNAKLFFFNWGGGGRRAWIWRVVLSDTQSLFWLKNLILLTNPRRQKGSRAPGQPGHFLTIRNKQHLLVIWQHLTDIFTNLKSKVLFVQDRFCPCRAHPLFASVWVVGISRHSTNHPPLPKSPLFSRSCTYGTQCKTVFQWKCKQKVIWREQNGRGAPKVKLDK